MSHETRHPADRRPTTVVALDALATRAALDADVDDPLFEHLDAEWHAYWHDPTSYYRWLAGCVATWRPSLAVELGNYTGAGTLALISELPEGSRFVSVDVRRDLRFLGPDVLRDRRLELVFGDDLDLRIFGSAPPAPVELLFVDTVHRRWQVEHEWRIYRHLLAPTAVVIFDDIRIGDMGQFWGNLDGEKLDLTESRHVSGFGVLLHRGPGPDLEAARKASSEALADRHRRGPWLDRWDRLVAHGAAWKSRLRSPR